MLQKPDRFCAIWRGEAVVVEPCKKFHCVYRHLMPPLVWVVPGSSLASSPGWFFLLQAYLAPLGQGLCHH